MTASRILGRIHHARTDHSLWPRRDHHARRSSRPRRAARQPDPRHHRGCPTAPRAGLPDELPARLPGHGPGQERLARPQDGHRERAHDGRGRRSQRLPLGRGRQPREDHALEELQRRARQAPGRVHQGRDLAHRALPSGHRAARGRQLRVRP